ncbi:predicted protein [Sparassis crispa]|uniref:Nucleoside diphosphate kinase n=1 Tax=Sparassis crispa TaxID=139825 RepID=A0A401GS14_9APHY|nr:predicted protein [Sparassis crispa]GBE85018.1 predicted protein [Sparassis crispa]
MSALGSTTSPPPLENEALEETSINPPQNSRITRTVAIIKTHALEHRFEIEHRISEAGFEIVKERQMEFDTETDPDTLFELFGDEYVSFAEGPVWVYVLERRKAVEVWSTLMGDFDPEVARQETPSALRAVYGLSSSQNAVMGSPDAQTAEIQIEAIFASSPPFPPTELPDLGDPVPAGSLRSVSSSVLSALRRESFDEGSNHSTEGSKGKGKVFKARPLPSTHAAPDIAPRMSRAAALRAGLPVDKAVHTPPTKERLAKTFENVPGHKRSETIKVASTAPPVVAPRMTRAAALRLGQAPPEKTKRPSTAGAVPHQENKSTFEGVPGHKRRESIAVASTRPPSVTPRSNRSASLRQQKEAAPPSSFMFRLPSQQTPSRSSSRSSLDETSSTTLSRPASVASVHTTSRPVHSRVVSTSTPRRSTFVSRPSTSAGVMAAEPKQPNGSKGKSETMEKAKARPPSITPRTNKSALLRAAKMANAATPTAGKAKPAPAAPRSVKV